MNAPVEYAGYHQFGAGKLTGDIKGDTDPLHLPGWYWQACFPVCTPHGEPSGPFATAKEAYDNAQEDA